MPMTVSAQAMAGKLCRFAWRRTGTVLAFLFAGLGFSFAQDAPAPRVRVITLDGAIGPAFADYLEREIEQAPGRGVSLLVMAMNTPGGLVSSMRAMVQDILAAPVPVVVYVTPQGAHAASAGTYILYAGHIAAMAPGTTVGAATPIEIGGGTPTPPAEEKPKGEPEQEKTGKDEAKKEPAAPRAPPGAADLKAVEDLVALIKGLAELRGRNVEWAERAVRQAATLTAREAFEQGVIDVVATDIPELLDQIDGHTVKLGAGEHTIKSKGAVIEYGEPGWVTRFLMVITDPNVAFILMTLGMYGLIFELSNPGAIFPGLLGAICLVVGLYALSVLPVNIAGATLIALGVGLMAAEAFTPGIGVLGIGGLFAFALGAVFLFDTDVPEFRIDLPVVIGVTAVTGGFLLLVIGYALNAQRRPVITGREQLIGRKAIVTQWAGTAGFVHVEGERWQARADEAFAPGDEVIVHAVEGLVLRVRRSNPKDN